MSLRAGLEIIRPVNCAMIGFAVIVGEFVSKPATVSATQSALGFLTGFFICAYSMAINDIYDAEVDRVNQPGRPIPSGRMTPQTANRLSVLALLAGMAFSVLTLSAAAVAVAAAYALLSWIYSHSAKKQGLAGNLIVASSLAIPFVYGGIISGGMILSSLLLLMALTAFLAGTGREVVKAMADVQGDEKRGINSVARARGMKAAAATGAAFFLLAVVTSWVPLVAGLANLLYTYGVVVPDAIFVYLAASIIRNRDPSNAHRVKGVALLGMLAGLLVFVGGGL
ncbi:MAG TPA: geranylgeranylglycerol-phosphate geranylgeranyltransferase [Nitrososphaerales archaeon]|nr:geranylgeranylglycerol-phosphate geranylgeranyltransferase [Nitrososphaerales archaeon]